MRAPPHIINHRRELCKSCPKPCEHQKDQAFWEEGNNACPIGRWPQFLTFTKNKWKGLGDAVAAVAEPIAGAMDKVLKTKVKGCSACAKRREMLNHLVPWGQKPPVK